MLTEQQTKALSGPTTRHDDRAGRSSDLWRRFQQVTRTAGWQALPERSVAVTTNLVRLVTVGEAADYLQLDHLVERYGHERVAAIQDRVDDLLGSSSDLPVLTSAIRRLSTPRPVEWRLRAAGLTRAEASRVAGRCFTHMFWMLLADVDHSAPQLLLPSPAALVKVIEHGNARQWRAVVAPLASNPWGPEGERLVSLATAAHLPLVERALLESRRVYRQREEARERSAVAREIRRMIAVSGLSQREFSAYVGTSPSRLSTYVTGKVTPSATMMLRIKGAARMLAQESQQAPVSVTGRTA